MKSYTTAYTILRHILQLTLHKVIHYVSPCAWETLFRSFWQAKANECSQAVLLEGSPESSFLGDVESSTPHPTHPKTAWRSIRRIELTQQFRAWLLIPDPIWPLHAPVPSPKSWLLSQHRLAVSVGRSYVKSDAVRTMLVAVSGRLEVSARVSQGLEQWPQWQYTEQHRRRRNAGRADENSHESSAEYRVHARKNRFSSLHRPSLAYFFFTFLGMGEESAKRQLSVLSSREFLAAPSCGDTHPRERGRECYSRKPRAQVEYKKMYYLMWFYRLEKACISSTS